MIRALVGNMFESHAQTLVNTVNCVGVMGKGIALEFKKRYPDMYDDYAARCAQKQVRLGEPYLYRSLFPPNILNFPTKDHWRSVSRLQDIVAGLEYLERHYQEWGITSLAVPPLGCGQGQLEWRVVGPTLYRYLSRFNIPVDLYAPTETPEAELDEGFLGRELESSSLAEASGERPRIAPAWVALVEIIARIEREPYHWPVGRTRFQKLAYFATEFGLPTGLEFQRGSYGPFAPELKPLLTKLVNNGLLREEKHGSMLVLKPGSTYDDARQTRIYREALAQWEPDIEIVTDLLMRMSTDDAEIAATVHFVWRSLRDETRQSGKRGVVSATQVLAAVKQWKQRRKPPLDDRAIEEAISNLYILGWINVEPDAESALSRELQLA